MATWMQLETKIFWCFSSKDQSFSKRPPRLTLTKSFKLNTIHSNCLLAWFRIRKFVFWNHRVSLHWFCKKGFLCTPVVLGDNSPSPNRSTLLSFTDQKDRERGQPFSASRRNLENLFLDEEERRGRYHFALGNWYSNTLLIVFFFWFLKWIPFISRTKTSHMRHFRLEAKTEVITIWHERRCSISY